MKYYLHDSNAFNDEKITRLYIQFGYEGLGLFYTCLEKFAQQEKPINTFVLKHQLNIGKRLEKCWLFMEQIGLLSSNNGETFNKQLLNFSESYKIKKEKNAKRISEWREKQDSIKNVTCNESVSNTPKVKLSKVNRSKEKEINISFDVFWDLYPRERKTKKKACIEYWKKLTDEKRQFIIDNLKNYIDSVSELQYVKQTFYFFKDEKYEDGNFIIEKTPAQKKAEHDEWTRQQGASMPTYQDMERGVK